MIGIGIERPLSFRRQLGDWQAPMGGNCRYGIGVMICANLGFLKEILKCRALIEAPEVFMIRLDLDTHGWECQWVRKYGGSTFGTEKVSIGQQIVPGETHGTLDCFGTSCGVWRKLRDSSYEISLPISVNNRWKTSHVGPVPDSPARFQECARTAAGFRTVPITDNPSLGGQVYPLRD
jgi:hypothetical protein